MIEDGVADDGRRPGRDAVTVSVLRDYVSNISIDACKRTNNCRNRHGSQGSS